MPAALSGSSSELLGGGVPAMANSDFNGLTHSRHQLKAVQKNS